MSQPTNCVVRSGGVFSPSAQLIGIIPPNCTGSKLRERAVTGDKTRRRVAGAANAG